MKVCVNNFMGCRKAEVEASKIALIVGLNHQGKSSLLRPISALLSGQVMPLGLKKSDAGLFVHTGEAFAEAKIESEAGTLNAVWSSAKAEIRSEGTKPPFASEIATGLISFADLEIKKKIEFLRNLLKCEPSKNDLVAYLKDFNISEEIAEKIWENICRDGWEASYKRACDKGRELKAQWNYLTGENWGAKKAASWFPENWENELETMSEDGLSSQVVAAKADYEYAIAHQAVEEADIDKLQSEANAIPQLELTIKQGEEKLAAALAVEKIAQETLDKIPSLPEEGLTCPHCGKRVLMQGGTLVSAELKLTESQKNTIKQQRLAANNALSNASMGVLNVRKTLNRLKEELQAANQAKARLAEKAVGNVTADDIDRRREAVVKAENRLQAFKQWREAARMNNNVISNQHIIDALDEDGIRAKAMEKGLQRFNDKLFAIRKNADWAEVAVDRFMNITLSGRPYILLSDSEKMRARIVLQLAIAEMDGSDVVIIDAAEILDPHGRGGLLRALVKCPFACFVGMMTPSRDKVPNLRKNGLGHVYWIENGYCEEL